MIENSELKTIIATLFAYFTIFVVFYRNTQILDSQSSQEVYDWMKERRGDYNKKKNDKEKRDKRNKKNAKKNVHHRNSRNRTLNSQSKESVEATMKPLVEFFKEFAKKIKDCSFTLRDHLKTIGEHSSHFRRSLIFQKAQLIFSMLVTLGFIVTKEFSFQGIKIFSDTNLRRQVSLFELTEEVWSFLALLWDRFWDFCTTLDIRAFYIETFSDSISDEYTFLITNFVMIEAGRIPTERIEPSNPESETREVPVQDYDRRLNEFVVTLNLKLSSCKDSEKSGYTAKLREIKALITKRTMAARQPARIKPFGILLFGGSGVAKSSIVTALMRAILKMNGFAHEPKSIITLNETDKFQSEYRSFHSGVIFDDLCNMKASQTSENPLDKVISFINTIPMAALNPNVELKGNVMIEPKMVAATTNVKDLQAHVWSNEELAILRRFDYTITQTIKPEYQKASGMLDTNKVTHMLADPFPDFALFTVEIPRYEKVNNVVLNKKGKTQATSGIAYDTVSHNGKLLVNIDLKTLLEFLRDVTKVYYAQQQIIADAKNAMDEIHLCDECSLPTKMCSCDKSKELDSQASITELSDQALGALLEFEAQVFDYINTTYLHYLLTIPSLAFVIWQNLEEYIEFITDLYALHATLIASLFVFDVFVRVPLGGFILAIGLTLMSIYHSSKQFATRMVYAMSPFRRPSEMWMDCSAAKRASILVGLVSLIGLGAVRYAIDYFNSFTTSEACEALPNDVVTKDLPPPDKDQKEDHPFWSTLPRLLKYGWKTDVTHRSRSMSITQSQRFMTNKQWTVQITKKDGKVVHCNCVPIESKIMLIPNHIVPDERCHVKIVRSKTYAHPAKIERADTFHIPNTDYALWWCPEIGDQKPLKDMFAGPLDKGNVVEFDLLYRDVDYDFVNMGHYAGTCSTTRTNKGGNFPAYTYYRPEGTFNGLCMATALAKTKEGFPFICGFHLAGKDKTGAIGAISRKQIELALEEIVNAPGRFPGPKKTPIATEIAGIPLNITPELKENHAVHSLPKDSNVVIHGSHSLPVGTFEKSRVQISKISPIVEKVTGIKREHGKATGLGDIKHKIKDIVRKGSTAYDFDEECFQKAVVDYDCKLDRGLTKKQLSTLGKISDDANLAGLDGEQGVNAIAMSTSMGFPFRGKKSIYIKPSERKVEGITCPLDAEEWIWDEVNAREDKLRSGERINMLSKASMKDESTKLTKEKRRVFAGSNTPDILLIRRYFLRFSALMQQEKELFECAVGIDVHSPEFTRLMNFVSEHGEDRIVAGDYASFDGQMAVKFMLAGFGSAIKLMMKSGNLDAEDEKVLRGLATEISYPTYDYFGVIVSLVGSNPSGHPLTVVINSIVNSLYMRYAYYVIAKEEKWWKPPLFHEVVNLITYGDDNEMGVKKGYGAFNHTRISEVLSRSGIKYTMADKEAKSVPFIKLTEASFLKHYPVWNPDLELYGARIEDSSIAKMLHTHMQSDALTEEQHCAESLQNVARAWFGFGREYYEKNIDQLYTIAREAKIAHLVGDLLTYDERVVEYKKKFKLAEFKTAKEEADVSLESQSINSLKDTLDRFIKEALGEYEGDLEADDMQLDSQSAERQSFFRWLARQLLVFGLSYTATHLYQLWKIGKLGVFLEFVKGVIDFIFSKGMNDVDVKGTKFFMFWMNWFARYQGFFDEAE